MFQKMKFIRCIFLMGSLFTTSSMARINFAHKPGEVIIKLKDKYSKSLNLKLNGIRQHDLLSDISNSVLLKFSDKSISIEERIKDLERNPQIEFAEPNYIYSIEDPKEERWVYRKRSFDHKDVPADPLFQQLWGLVNTGTNEPVSTPLAKKGVDIGADKAWSISKGVRQVKVAVIDTGIDYNHPDLRENLWVNSAEKNGVSGVDDDGNGYIDDIHGYDFANEDGDPLDGNGHGTHCAGTIGAAHDNGYGVAGVMGNVELVALKFLSDNGQGDSASAIRAIDYATTMDVDIMSNSWGGGAFSELVKQAIERASEQGIVFVAAAGNSAGNNDLIPHYPSSYDVKNIVSVAAHTANDKLASFSCYGRSSVDIAAPGQNILSTYKGGVYKVLSGTSMATPHVSGALGLLVSEEGRLTHEQLKERLIETSVPVSSYRGRVQKAGRLNAFNLLVDHRPLRVEPEQGQWKTLELETPWESEHPYAVDLNVKKSFKIEGAKFIRLVINKIDLEEFYDYLEIYDESGNSISQITGLVSGEYSDYVEGEQLDVLFRSDRSITKWGYLIEKLEWQ